MVIGDDQLPLVAFKHLFHMVSLHLRRLVLYLKFYDDEDRLMGRSTVVANNQLRHLLPYQALTIRILTTIHQSHSQQVQLPSYPPLVRNKTPTTQRLQL